MWGAFLRWFFWWRPPALLRRVIVNLRHDTTEAFEGVLWSYRGCWLVLKDVSALKGGQPPVPLPGELLIHQSNIATIQAAPS